MRYIVIRDSEGIVGIVKLPDIHIVRRVFRKPDFTILSAEKITEAQYTSYEEFELAPVFSWIPIPDEKNYVDVYDPEFFITDDTGVYNRTAGEGEQRDYGQYPFKKGPGGGEPGKTH